MCFSPSDSRLQIYDATGTVVWSSSSTTDAGGNTTWNTGYSVSGGVLSLDTCTLSVQQGGTTYFQDTTPQCNQLTLANDPQGDDKCWSATADNVRLLWDSQTQLELDWQFGYLYLNQGSTDNVGGDRIWQSGVDGSLLCLQADGNFVVYEENGGVAWAAGSNSASPMAVGVEACGLVFEYGTTQYHRSMATGCAESSVPWGWCRMTSAHGTVVSNDAVRVDWGSDGYLRMYDTSNQVQWQSGNSQPGSSLCFQDDGTLVIYGNASGEVLWEGATPRTRAAATP